MKIDPRSARIALHYTGNDAGEPAISGVPARDLTENDIARLVYVEHGDLSGAAHAASVEKLVDRLTDGPYRKTAPESKSTPKPHKEPAREPTSTPAHASDAPADPPADEPKE